MRPPMISTRLFLLLSKNASHVKLLGLRSTRKLSYIRQSRLHRTLKVSNESATSLATVHTTKGWKIVAKTGQKNPELSKEQPTSCEEGSNALLHEELLNRLQICNSMQNQLEVFSSLTSIPLEEVERRNDFCQSLESLFKPYFKEYKVNQFGSGANGLGFPGSDIDVSLQTCFTDDKPEEVILPSVPTLEDLTEGRITSETVVRMKPRYLLRFIRRILRQHCTDIKEPIFLIKARIPILRFYNEKYDLFCDFSCENKASLMNTKLFVFLGHLDTRFVPLTKLLRYWGKYAGFVGDIEMFNSYAFSLLVVYFLQTTQPPVLPTVQDILAKSDYLSDGKLSDMDTMLREIGKFEPSKNNKSVDELFREFFFYYLLNDFSRVMIPMTASSVNKFDFKSNEEFEMSTVTLQDPFRPSVNATFGASYKSCMKFLNGVMHVCDLFQNENLLDTDVPAWGLGSIFHRPIWERQQQQNLVHRLEMVVPDPASATHTIRDILEHGLFMTCHEFKLDSSEQSSRRVLLKLQCQACHNTWIGRQGVAPSDGSGSLLEEERAISKHLMVKKTELKRQVLVQFTCECCQTGEDRLEMVFTFQESKFPPIVAIFLKEYLPRVLKKCSDENAVMLAKRV